MTQEGKELKEKRIPVRKVMMIQFLHSISNCASYFELFPNVPYQMGWKIPSVQKIKLYGLFHEITFLAVSGLWVKAKS